MTADSTTGSAATARQEYSTTPADIAVDRERILALWREGLAQNGMPEAKFDWYYRDNVEGPPAVLFLRAAGDTQPVGVASLGRRRMRRGTETLVAGALADFIVVPAHRSFFPALHLQQAMRRHGLASQPVVFGMPNPQSEAVVRRAGYRRVGDLVRSARVVRSSAYFSRHLPLWLAAVLGAGVDGARHALTAVRARRTGALGAHWSDRPHAGADALWERAVAGGALMGVRDTRFLTWRFVDCPLYRYRFLNLVGGNERELAAYAVCLERDHTTHVCDFLADDAVPGAAARLWLELALDAYRRGQRSASVEFLGPAEVRRGIEAAGWVARERQALYATFEGRDELRDEAAWYLTAADEDA